MITPQETKNPSYLSRRVQKNERRTDKVTKRLASVGHVACQPICCDLCQYCVPGNRVYCSYYCCAGWPSSELWKCLNAYITAPVSEKILTTLGLCARCDQTGSNGAKYSWIGSDLVCNLGRNGMWRSSSFIFNHSPPLCLSLTCFSSVTIQLKAIIPSSSRPPCLYICLKVSF